MMGLKRLAEKMRAEQAMHRRGGQGDWPAQEIPLVSERGSDLAASICQGVKSEAIDMNF